MSTLHFLPWCRLERPYHVGEFALLPVSREIPTPNLDEADKNSILTILNHFRDVTEEPVHEFTVASCDSRGLLADLTDEESASLQEMVALACFSALADREFEHEVGKWSNTDCFRLHSYGPWTGSAAPDNAFRVLRRDGHSVLQAGFSVKYHIPMHAAVVEKIHLPEPFLRSLWQARESWSPDEWQKWREAIVTFNRANSDSPDVSWRVDWILMCAAFQRLLGKPGKAVHKQEETIKGFRKHLVKPAKRLGLDPEILCEWVGEFCSMRGDFAHGKRHPTQPRKWSSDQVHLTVGAVAFPLLVRLLLHEENVSTLGTAEYATLAALVLFLEQERNKAQKRSELWRIILDKRLEVAIRLGLAQAHAN
jgi:hypothetical protein